MKRIPWIVLGLSGLASLSAQPNEGEVHNSSDRFYPIVSYQQRCSRCHELQPAIRYSDVEWGRILRVMARRAQVTDSERDRILAFLQLSN